MIYLIVAIEVGEVKKEGKQNIAPLQPLTLASFQTWGGSAGAGRICLPTANL
jgi:hypothetical protein